MILFFFILERTDFPASYAWVRRFEDLSGQDTADKWEVTNLVRELLRFAGRVYLPFLEANQAAMESDRKEVEVDLWGGEVRHRQGAFKYQVKCYDLLKKAYGSLADGEKEKVAQVLHDTGCAKYFLG